MQHLLLIYQLACTLCSYDITSCPEAHVMQCLKVVVVIFGSYLAGTLHVPEHPSFIF